MTLPAIKVGFVLLSPSSNPIPSTRIAVLNMFPYLRSGGFDPHIVFEPGEASSRPDVSGLAPRLIGEGFQVIVFQKVGGPSVEALAEQLRAAGIRTVFCVCDLIDPDMAAATDATVVISDFLKSLYPPALQHKIHIVHDGIEHPERFRAHASRRRGSLTDPLRAVLVTSVNYNHLPQIVKPPRWLHVTIVGRYVPPDAVVKYARQMRLELQHAYTMRELTAYLRFLADWRIRCVAWSPVSVYRHMLDADVGIIPIAAVESASDGETIPSWKVKSENRLSMKMSLGLPVVATPIPSYEPLIRQGENGFFARTRGEWIEHLDTLRDPAVRERIGQAARASVLQRYSMEEQGRLLANVLRSLVVRNTLILP